MVKGHTCFKVFLLVWRGLMIGQAMRCKSAPFLEFRSLSFAFWWTWVWVLFFPGDEQLLSPYPPFPWWATFLAASSISGLIFLTVPSFSKLLAARRPKTVVGTALTVISVALFYVVNAPALFVLVACAGFLSTFWGAWSLGCLSECLRDMPSSISSSMFIAAILCLLTIGRPMFTEAVLSALLPLVSAAFALIGGYADCEEEQPSRTTGGCPLRKTGIRALLPHIVSECPASSLVLFFCASVFGFFGSYMTQKTNSEMAPVIIATIAIASLLLWLALETRGAAPSTAEQYASSVSLYVLGLVALIAGMVFDKGFIPVAAVLVVGGWLLNIVFGWSSFIGSQGEEALTAASSTLCILLIQIGTLCGSALMLLAVSAKLSGTSELAIPLLLIVLLVILLAALTVRSVTLARHADNSAVTGENGVEGAGTWSNEALRLAARFSLSERETEVCNYLLAGYSLQAIANQMTVAKSTIATHAQHVYRKCGVHDRRELTLLIGSEGIGGGNPLGNEPPNQTG